MIINHDGDNAAGTATPSFTSLVNGNAGRMQHFQQDHLESHPQKLLLHQQQQLKTLMVGQVYRFCFALNNAGVSLMEQGQYPQALMTFRVTASAIRSLVHLSAQQEQAQAQQEQALVTDHNNARLHKLLTSLDAHLTQASRAVAQPHGGTNHRDGARVGFPNVDTVEEDDLANLRETVQYGSMTTGTIFPIRLRHSYLPSSMAINHHPLSSLACTEDSSSHCNNKEYEDYGFSIAIIFYNYGLAQPVKAGCFLECKNDWDKQMLAVGQLYTLALRFLSQGNMTLDNHIADYDVAATDAADQPHDQQCRSLQCLFLLSLVLSNLTTVCKYDRVRALELTLDRLQLEQNEHWESWLCMESAIGIASSTAAVTALAA